MANKNNIDIIISATDNASKQFDEVSKNTKKFTDSLKDVRKYSWIATTALVWLWSIMVKQATDIEPVKDAFKNLTETVWESSTQMLKSLKDASKWAVSEYDLMLSANRALKLWVSENTQDMTDLMKIARLYGQQMGQDVTQSFNDIVTWLGRWSPMILDNLWIIIDSEKAYEDYALSLWKSASELTKQEKTQALVNATLVEGRKALDEFWEPAQTMAERFAELKNTFSDIAWRIGGALLPVIEKLLNVIQPIIDKVASRIEANPELAANILLVTTAVTWLIFVLSTVWSIIPTITAAISVITGPIGLVIAAIGALWVAYATNFWGFRDFVNEIWAEISPVIQELAQAFIDCFWEIRNVIKDVYQKLEPLLIPLWNLFKDAVVEALKMVVDIVVISFKNIAETIKWITQTFSEIIDFINNIFSWNREAAFQNLQNIVQIWIDTVIAIFSNFWIDLPAVFETLKTTINTIWNSLFDGLKNICSWAVDRISDKVSRVWDRIQAAKDAIASLWWWWSSWWRASWWVVLAWETYRVNEIHWDYFTPAVNGRITPAPTTNSPNLSINFNGNIAVRNDEDFEIIKSTVKEVIMESYKNLSMWYI